MSPSPGNSNDFNDQQPPLSLERRERTDQLANNESPSQPADDTDAFRPIEVSDEVTVYSAKSIVRSPSTLIRNIFTDFWAGRELAWRLFLRNIRGLYRQTFLGLFWAFLPPIANTAIWIFLGKAGMLKLEETGVDSTVYILTGMIMWQAFIDAFQMPLGMLNKNRNMIGKLNFPREALLLVGIGEVVFNLLIRLLLLIPAFMWYGVTPPLTILLAPLAIVGLILLGTALGLLIMPFGSLYQDVGRFISMTLPLWMITTPVVYPPKTAGLGTLLNWLNPASPLLIVGRDWLLIGSFDFFWIGLAYGLATIPLVLLGLMVFRISIPVLVERMSA